MGPYTACCWRASGRTKKHLQTRDWAKQLSKWLYIAVHQEGTHIGSEASLIPYLDFLAGAIWAR